MWKAIVVQLACVFTLASLQHCVGRITVNFQNQFNKIGLRDRIELECDRARFKNFLPDGDQAGDILWDWNGTEIHLYDMPYIGSPVNLDPCQHYFFLCYTCPSV